MPSKDAMLLFPRSYYADRLVQQFQPDRVVQIMIQSQMGISHWLRHNGPKNRIGFVCVSTDRKLIMRGFEYLVWGGVDTGIKTLDEFLQEFNNFIGSFAANRLWEMTSAYNQLSSDEAIQLAQFTKLRQAVAQIDWNPSLAMRSRTQA